MDSGHVSLHVFVYGLGKMSVLGGMTYSVASVLTYPLPDYL